MRALRSCLRAVAMVAPFGMWACGSSVQPTAPPDQDDGGAAGALGRGGSQGVGGSVDAAAGENPCGATDSSLEKKDATELFGASGIAAFDLYLPDEAWRDLRANARLEEYTPAQACFQGKAIGVVGLRFKGSYGSLYNCFDESGQNTCRKLGMKLKFDEYASGQRFFGLKRLNLQGYRYDDSYLKERLSYDLYREMNLAAPRATWALVRVNGEAQGLFGMVEQIDGRFTSDRWPDDGDGNLFKEIWPGQEDATWIRQHLETNKDTGDLSVFQGFSSALNSAPEAELRSTLARFMDLDGWAAYMAVDDAIANFDGITTYYTSGTPDQAGNHNFYLYQHANGTFTLIPWDLESTFYLAPEFADIPPWRAVPTDCNLTYPVWSGDSRVVAPGCNRVFRALSSNLDAYRAAGQRLLDGPFAVDRMLGKIDALASSIRAEAAADPHGPGAAEFENGVTYLRSQMPKLHARLAHMLSGTPSTPLRIDPAVGADFETADDYGIVDGPLLMCNSHSEVSVALETAAPIAGTKTLRMLFEYGNEARPWEQWMFYSIPFRPSPSDLTPFVGMRFKVRADRARSMRIDIDSPKNSAANEGVEFGWEVDRLTTTPTERSVRFAEATVPDWANDPGDDLTEVLRTSTGIRFKPDCLGQDADGQLPDGTHDKGWVDIDDIVFF